MLTGIEIVVLIGLVLFAMSICLNDDNNNKYG